MVLAVLGQRIYAVSRDLYDIFSLIEHVDDRKVLAGLPRKMDASDVGAESVDVGRMTERKDEFRADWSRNLAGPLPPGAEQPFEEVRDAVVGYVADMAGGLDQRPKGAEETPPRIRRPKTRPCGAECRRQKTRSTLPHPPARSGLKCFRHRPRSTPSPPLGRGSGGFPCRSRSRNAFQSARGIRHSRPLSL